LKLPLIISLYIFAASVQATLYKDYDRFNGLYHEETGEWGFKGENVLDDGLSLSLVPARTTLKNGSQIYRLKLQWSGPPLNFVEYPPTLVLLVDKQRFELASAKNNVYHLIDDRISDHGDVLERMEFITTADLIQRIANAKSVELALYTARGRLERSFDKGNIKIFKEFVDNIINKN
jgi:hypothetical protein